MPHVAATLQADKCGDHKLYLPACGGRTSGNKTSRYKYRISLQASRVFGLLWKLSLVTPADKKIGFSAPQ
eukprot:6185256-Pleurochrysis_carterae.AAC.1